MKNTLDLTPILLPTKDASELFIHKGGNLCLNKTGIREKTEFVSPQHLYLTSNREIKEGYYYYSFKFNDIQKSIKGELVKGDYDDCIIIEFTTDPKLIANGVLAIPEFITIKEKESGDSIRDGWNKRVNFLEEYCKRYNQKDSDNLEERKIVKAQQYALSKCGAGEMGSLTKVKLAWENGFETALTYQKDNQKGVDAEKLVETFLKTKMFTKATCYTDNGTFYIDGLKALIVGVIKEYQSLQSNAGGFSLRDMEEAFQTGKVFQSCGSEITFGEFIQSLTKSQPKGDIIIECEMDEGFTNLKIGDEIPQKIKLDSNGQPVMHFK